MLPYHAPPLAAREAKMKKILLLTIVPVFLGITLVGAQTVTYTVSATIPAIVGVNVSATAVNSSESNAVLDREIERVVRSNETILLETIVPR